jgi:rSAM/selenodomain-associated transferase 2
MHTLNSGDISVDKDDKNPNGSRQVNPDDLIAIVIPTFQEESTIKQCLTHLQAQAPPFEVIVADGGSEDQTLALAQSMTASLSYPCQVLLSPKRGRSAQMNWGATQTQAEILLFLHADSLLPSGGLELMRQALTDPQVVGGRFAVKLDSPNWPYPLISWGINTRSRLTGYFTGDMGIFIRRSLFMELGGYWLHSLMEDLDLAGRMQKAGKVVFLSDPITTSSRRFQKHGPWRTILWMQILRVGYRLGISPERLAQWYQTVR